VGDNTGFAVSFLEDSFPEEERRIVQEGHDSIVQDIPDTEESIRTYLERTIQAFDRPIRFHNGIEINIPVEAEIGYDFDLKVSLKTLDLDGIREAKKILATKIEKRRLKEEAESALDVTAEVA
jgi:hypothetical protein